MVEQKGEGLCVKAQSNGDVYDVKRDCGEVNEDKEGRGKKGNAEKCVTIKVQLIIKVG